MKLASIFLQRQSKIFPLYSSKSRESTAPFHIQIMLHLESLVNYIPHPTKPPGQLKQEISMSSFSLQTSPGSFTHWDLSHRPTGLTRAWADAKSTQSGLPDGGLRRVQNSPVCFQTLHRSDLKVLTGTSLPQTPSSFLASWLALWQKDPCIAVC